MTASAAGARSRVIRSRAQDGQVLDVLVLEPTIEPSVCVLLGHAMMVDRRTLWRPDRPSLGGTLLDAGFTVLLPALRGHPPSGPAALEGAGWTYDELVEDTPTYLDLAREVAPDQPVLLVGHSLFGHTSLAFLGRYPEHPATQKVAGLVAIASAPWGPQWTPDWRHRVVQRVTYEAVGLMARLFGRVPARRLGFGTADESRAYWDDLVRVVRTGRWRARDGFDYWRGLASVRCPVLWVASEGDRLVRPEFVARFGAPVPRGRMLRVGGPDTPRADIVLARPPSHMGVVTSSGSEPVWRAVADWAQGRAGAAAASHRAGTEGERTS